MTRNKTMNEWMNEWVNYCSTFSLFLKPKHIIKIGEVTLTQTDISIAKTYIHAQTHHSLCFSVRTHKGKQHKEQKYRRQFGPFYALKHVCCCWSSVWQPQGNKNSFNYNEFFSFHWHNWKENSGLCVIENKWIANTHTDSGKTILGKHTQTHTLVQTTHTFVQTQI